MAGLRAILAAGAFSFALGGGAWAQSDPFGALHESAAPSQARAPGLQAPLGAGPTSGPARTGAQGLFNAVGASYSSAEMRGQTTSLAQLSFLPKTVAPLDMPFKAIQSGYLAKRPRIAIPQYAIAFVTGYQSAGSAMGAGSDITPRSTKVTTTLIGVSDSLKQQLVEEAYADLLARLKAAGIDVVPAAEVQAAPHLQKIGRPEHIRGGDVARMWTVWNAKDAPLIAGFSTDGGLAQSGSLMQLGNVSKELDAVLLMPIISIDHMDIVNSGRSNYGGQATVQADLNFHVSPSYVSFIWGNDRGGSMPGALVFQRKAAAGELFGILYKTDDRSDSKALHNAMAEAGFGSIYRQSIVYGAEVVPERYAALTRAAFQGVNQTIVDQILRARAGK